MQGLKPRALRLPDLVLALEVTTGQKNTGS